MAGSLEIASNDPDESLLEVALSGTGTDGSAVEMRLNAGGEDYTDGEGDTFEADRAFSAGDMGYTGGTAITFTNPVSGTDDDALYQSLRGGPSFSYAFDGLPSATYQVTLHFIEPFATGSGRRQIDVTAEGVLVLDDFDIFAAAGGKDVAHSETFSVQVSDGRLDLSFTAAVGANAIVSALAVVSGELPPVTGPVYLDVAGAVGLVLAHDLGAVCDPPPMGSGSAWADFDNDGDVDLYVTNRGGANHLYRNDGDPSGDGLPDFADVAGETGVADPTGAGHAAVFIDYDNDGDQDLYVTNWNGNVLFHNRLIETGAATFSDVTAMAGLADDGRAITAAWGDFDVDGDLDVYLSKHFECMPSVQNSFDRLYRSNGDGTFSDVTGWLCPGGMAPCAQTSALGFAAGWLDYDNDADLDLYLVNDDIGGLFGPNVLWRNDGPDGSGGWLFTDVSAASGADLSVNGMGLGVGDYDNDGYFDLAFSEVGPNRLLHSEGDGTFTEVEVAAGVDRPIIPATGSDNVTWGTVFFDHDNDGWLDLLFVAGSLDNPVPESDPQPEAFFRNNRDGLTFTDISDASGLNHPGRGRNASIVDLDGDGFVDVFIGNLGQPPLLYHNRGLGQGSTNHWLTVTVEGTTSNRDGIGTRLTLQTPDGLRQIREITSGPTHGGGDYRAAFFGLGANISGTLVVRWPTGEELDLGTVSADQALHVVEP